MEGPRTRESSVMWVRLTTYPWSVLEPGRTGDPGRGDKPSSERGGGEKRECTTAAPGRCERGQSRRAECLSIAAE